MIPNDLIRLRQATDEERLATYHQIRKLIKSGKLQEYEDPTNTKAILISRSELLKNLKPSRMPKLSLEGLLLLAGKNGMNQGYEDRQNGIRSRTGEELQEMAVQSMPEGLSGMECAAYIGEWMINHTKGLHMEVTE